MADLKAGTTVGGTLVWTQGNFPLFPTGNTLLYKNFVLYSENNKPQAVDNDFVSKAEGGTYLNRVVFDKGLSISGDGITNNNGINLFGNYSGGVPNIGIFAGLAGTHGIHGSISGNTRILYLRTDSVGGWIFKYSNTNVASINTSGTFSGNAFNAILQPTVASHVTRKDYVDNLINTTTINVNSRVLRSGDIMTGNLTAPNFITLNLATSSNHVPQLGQVIQRAVVLDYGTF